jgi:hypothetical protein
LIIPHRSCNDVELYGILILVIKYRIMFKAKLDIAKLFIEFDRVAPTEPIRDEVPNILRDISSGYLQSLIALGLF